MTIVSIPLVGRNLQSMFLVSSRLCHADEGSICWSNQTFSGADSSFLRMTKISGLVPLSGGEELGVRWNKKIDHIPVGKTTFYE
jgi:hypothetical protein